MEKKAEVLYLKVTKDKYELPEAVAGSAFELAMMIGVKKEAVLCGIAHAKKNGTWSCYRRIEIEEEQ